MGDNLFSVLISTIKSRFASIVSKIKLWTSWNFIRTKVIGGIRDFFFKLLDVRPKHKNDYYTIFGWMVSKRLAYAIVIIIGVLSVWYITSTTKVFSAFTSTGGLRTYKYDSLMLRLASKRVRITGKSGYLAYEGEVSKGYVNGNGDLYSPQGILLYSGTFEKNMYEGQGIQYFDSGAIHYNGNFHKNLYEGKGLLYRENGSQSYDGEFLAGMKSGKGKLFDTAGNLIYDGSFSSDSILYSELLGKTAEDVSKMYLGKQILYEDGSDSSYTMVSLQDIKAIYVAEGDASASDDAATISSVLVLKDEFGYGEKKTNDIGALTELLGNPVFEGNTVVTLPEAVAVNQLNDLKYSVKGKVDMDTTAVFDDDIVVNNYDGTYSVYVYTYEKGGLAYTFICKERGGHFFFYEIMDSGSGS